MTEHNSIAVKIAKASAAVGGSLKADARNADQNYNYISADKILTVAGQALADAGVAILPAITNANVETATYTNKYGEKTRHDATVTFVMTIAADDGQIEMPWIGCGNDYIVPDKAIYKAITSGHKYFIMKLLNIGEGNEDGEHETKAPDQSAQRQPERPVQRPAVQKPAPAPVVRTQRNDAQELLRDVDEVEGKHHGYNAEIFLVGENALNSVEELPSHLADFGSPLNPDGDEYNPFHDDKTSLRDIVFEGSTGKFVEACRREGAASDRVCTPPQYGFLKSVIISIGSKETHHDILHVLAGRQVDSENLPPFGLAKYLLDVLPAESGNKGDKVKNTDARHPGAVAAVKEIHAKLSA